MENSYLDVKLKRIDRVYKPTEKVDGSLMVNVKKGWSHNGIDMVVEGSVVTTHSGKGLQSDVNNRPILLMRKEMNITPAGKFSDGYYEIPFQFDLNAAAGQKLRETYHGVFVSVVYLIIVTCERGLMKSALRKEVEFIVEVPTPASQQPTDPKPVSFTISPKTLENVSEALKASVPNFAVSGKLYKSVCPINQPLTGELCIELSAATINSVELQLVRVESISLDDRVTKEATEVQNIQIGEGDICRNFTVPMYMVFPKLYSCPTLETESYKVQFEMNMIIVFGDGYMITETFPLTIYRPS